MAALTDFLVIGGGIVGLTTALALRRRQPGARVTVLEKEAGVGAHASGRNSGVLHAGFYYTADSLKARFSREGNLALQAWCADRALPLRRCGKLVVARSEADHPGLDELLRRAQRNGVPLEPIDEDEARRIEPRVRTVGRALFSPSTASVDPNRVVESMLDEARRLGIEVRTGVRWLGRRGDVQQTSVGDIAAGFVVNAAGLYADRIAAAWGRGAHYRILPFKGLYLYGDREERLACHVYPVPDLAMPFLGVHFTVTTDGAVKIGPTALPALWRENYGGLERISIRELAEVLGREARMFLADAAFRKLAVHELKKALRRNLLRDAARLVEGIDPSRWTRWGRPGIRAQLVDLRTGALEMDFVVEQGHRSLHVLNAVSPAFTCSLPFAEHLVDRIVGPSSAAPG